MRIRDLLTKERFTKWLKNQSPNRRFKIGCENHCVVAQYLHDNGYKDPYVDGTYCSFRIGSQIDLTKSYKLPNWVSSFVDAFDAGRVGSPKTCLKILQNKI